MTGKLESIIPHEDTKEFVECDCGEFYSNPFKCLACGRPRLGKQAEFTYMEIEEIQTRRNK